MKKKKKFYAVASGRKSGVFSEWGGENGAQAQVIGYPGAKFKSFYTEEEARHWLSDGAPLEPSAPRSLSPTVQKHLDQGNVVMYTDGGCSYNPGPGGYGVVLISNNKRKELSQGYRRTTNNRMELMAVIKGLEALKKTCDVMLFSDSKYVVDTISKGWAKKWRKDNWIRSNMQPAENADLWDRLLNLLETHNVKFNWVKGHAGNTENERCDQLATQASADSTNHLIDDPFESGRTTGNPG